MNAASATQDAAVDGEPTASAGADPLALESQLCFALAVASRTVIDAYRSELEPLNLTHPQYLVMLALWEHRSLSLTRLCELLMLEAATLSPMVKRLERVGYVRRTRNPDDERQLAIELTEEGRALRERAQQVPLAMMQKFQMTPGDIAKLRDVVSGVTAAATAAR
ncbi:MarR family winged helix-turn-helix transcriptional regulator [Paramicrobacterium agarici]|uniref:MarR family winged helix-turn-helix transcriptional regulator n=1 Tax=Paramicrobacterium agarici TaxID=630514 RepID=UPI001150E301|nr:MarR family transcriptional regulator [Microbacterium agarici]TQO23047.1 DNA-binding MarR family transcriptional regulator [Microbacterium agarici]